MRRSTLLFAALLLLVGAGRVFAWSFAVCGDSRDDRNGIFPQILAAVDNSDMELLVHTGDMVGRDSERDWSRFREVTASFRKPLKPVIGNHELYGGGTREKFAKRLGLPGSSYSFTYKDAHFAIVDNAGGAMPDDVLAWLDRDLAAHPKGKDGVAFLIVAMHTPPETRLIRPHGTGLDYEEQSAELLAILKKHDADAVLAGHEHLQHVENWGGVLLVVSGGAGAPLVPLQRYGFYRIDLERGAVRETFRPIMPAR
jgi:predicted phosphodiesterase